MPKTILIMDTQDDSFSINDFELLLAKIHAKTQLRPGNIQLGIELALLLKGAQQEYYTPQAAYKQLGKTLQKYLVGAWLSNDIWALNIRNTYYNLTVDDLRKHKINVSVPIKPYFPALQP